MADEQSIRGRTEERRPRLPRLGDSLRFYVEDTLRARLRGPGIEHYPPRRRAGPGLRVAAALAAAAVVAALLWLLSAAAR